MISMPTLRGTAALVLLLAAAMGAGAEESALTRRALDLRATPGEAGAAVAHLAAQAPVTRLDGRQGPWIQVRTAEGATGWIHLFDLGPAASGVAAPASGNVAANALRGVTNLFGGGASRQTGTTAGIRGLEAEQLANAQPNPAAVQRMSGWRQSEADARAYAGRAAWKPVAVDPLPPPSRAGATNPEQAQ